METARRIRAAVDSVSLLRQTSAASPGIASSIGRIKRFQSRRFSGTYADLLGSSRFGPAALFFLEELYSDSDFAQRDAQFARIAGAIEKFFPKQVAQTAVALAELHALTEELDHAMGAVLPSFDTDRADASPAQYLAAWRQVNRRADREAQLRVVLGIGHELARLTRTPGIRLLLKMMRAPANAANLGALQNFLEAGFDTFAALARRGGGVDEFLAIIEERETDLIAAMFDAEFVALETKLHSTLGLAR
jgi:hypothetical protein